MRERILEFSLDRPKTVFAIVIAMVVALAAQIPRIHIDTDPENMLPAEQVDRVFHHETKARFGLHDALVVGVVHERDPDGVFNPESLARLHELSAAIKAMDGVIAADLMSLSTVDNIAPGGPGTVRFEWLMAEPPQSRDEARAIRDAAQRLPMYQGTLVSEDGKAAAIYVPIEAKDQSYRIAEEIEQVIAGFEGETQFFVTGQPVAQDTFGVEMFKQMALAAPAAAVVIFLLMLLFFRSSSLIVSPMLVAMATVVAIMGLLIGMGFTVHIMSSMIPIFLMPIAVVDSVHILSEFADDYPETMDARATIRHVVRSLFTPMLYTSLTSAAGFASLALTPIPPVRVFGVFVALGILLAFILTVTFIPAYVVSLSPARLRKMAAFHTGDEGHSILTRGVAKLGRITAVHGKPILAVAVAVIAVSAYGITRIQINDNPVRWFNEDHQIRVADRVLNEHFAGTYMAYLVLEQGDDAALHDALDARVERVLAAAADAGVDLSDDWAAIAAAAPGGAIGERLQILLTAVDDAWFAAPSETAPYWAELLEAIEAVETEAKAFQDPAAVAYLDELQAGLAASGLVGKSSSLADVVRTVHRELRDGDPAAFSIPDSRAGVAQTLLSYQSSHRPGDLWHMVTPDYRAAAVWLQLTSGDNQDMAAVEAYVDDWLASNPPPAGVDVHWAGMTYLNVVWQQLMVAGMLESLLGSFVIVLLMMVVLFRSVLFGLLSMIPLSATIALIYGLIGLVGKDYDMPIAVLSSLTLGLSIDFAIHFIERMREIYDETGCWPDTMHRMFHEPGRAITRNAVVIAVGFLPLLLSPLVPYNTVGIFMALIMASSATATMVLLPAIVERIHVRLFPASAAQPTAYPKATTHPTKEVSA